MPLSPPPAYLSYSGEGTWLFAPFLFNPSGFEWQKILDGWTDWHKWISNREGVGVPPERSWESRWEKEHEHLQHSGKRALIRGGLANLKREQRYDRVKVFDSVSYVFTSLRQN
ncbi:Glycosyl transferase, family 48 [Sesbania bispinosa]|nr:Glycosyl transferase, family 48 [Sesbania bispinosa]